jgi:hypothetical protein
VNFRNTFRDCGTDISGKAVPILSTQRTRSTRATKLLNSSSPTQLKELILSPNRAPPITMILEILSSLALGYLARSLLTMEINYRRASSMGIPLVRLIIDPQNLLWMVLELHLWPYLDRLPVNLGNSVATPGEGGTLTIKQTLIYNMDQFGHWLLLLTSMSTSLMPTVFMISLIGGQTSFVQARCTVSGQFGFNPNVSNF